MYAVRLSALRVRLNSRLGLNFMALLGVAVMTTSPLDWVGALSLVLLLTLVITGTQAENLYVFISLIPFHHLISFQDRNVIFVLLLIAMLKVVYWRLTVVKQVPLVILPAIGLLSLTFVWDFGTARLGELLYLLCSLGYFLVVMTLVDLRAYNHGLASKHLLMSLAIALVTMLLSPGMDLSALSGSMVRFGYDLRILGGAMGAPIYSLMAISILVVALASKKTTLIQKVLMIVIIAGLVVIGISTISRVFLLGAGTLIIVAIAVALRKYVSISYRILIVCLLALMLYVGIYTAIPVSLLEHYAFRVRDSGFLSGRLDIFLSIFEYMSQNPDAILVGRGLTYSQIGLMDGWAFQALAHNLYLDGLMSWGLVGLTFLAIVFLRFLKRCKAQGQVTLVTALPAIVLLSTYITWGSFSYFNTYMYLIFVSIGAFSHTRWEGKYEGRHYYIPQGDKLWCGSASICSPDGVKATGV